MLTRDDAVRAATARADDGTLLEQLRRRVAHRTESQDPASGPAMRAYLDEVLPAVRALGFDARVVENRVSPGHPFLLAHRVEDPARPRVLLYGHGDVQRAHAPQWRAGLDPWQVTVEGERWYGRGTADNKGQHTVHLLALESVLRARGGRLGWNASLLLDMGEEVGSPGLPELCADLHDELAGDLLLGSDGPRVSAERPTVFLGSRGVLDLVLRLRARDRSHHSGNWGGLLRGPATVLAHALATLVDARGRILVDGLRPPPVPDAVRRALADVEVGTDPGDPAVEDWGEPGLSPAERLVAWNALEVVAMTAGTPEAPVGAIPGEARLHCQLRSVVGTPWLQPGEDVAARLREHLAARGFGDVEVEVGARLPATRLDPEDPWVTWALASLRATTGKRPALLPNLGGSLPNAAFAQGLGLPTVWVPHSHPGCAQHAPDEHALQPVLREGLAVMAGLFWDLGELDAVPPRAA